MSRTISFLYKLFNTFFRMQSESMWLNCNFGGTLTLIVSKMAHLRDVSLCIFIEIKASPTALIKCSFIQIHRFDTELISVMFNHRMSMYINDCDPTLQMHFYHVQLQITLNALLCKHGVLINLQSRLRQLSSLKIQRL